jgi:hypothetical protein
MPPFKRRANRVWTPAEDALILDNSIPRKELAYRLNAGLTTIYTRTRKLGGKSRRNRIGGGRECPAFLPYHQYDFVTIKAKELKTSRGEIIRMALGFYIESQNKPAEEHSPKELAHEKI